MPDLVDLLGLAAAILLIAGFLAKSMRVLRALSILAALMAAAYGLGTGTIWLAAIALGTAAVNAWRLAQIIRLGQRMAAGTARRSGDYSAVYSHGVQVDIGAGAAVFRRGDPVDAFYVIESGKVQLQEVGITLGAGEILGEIGFFTDAETRTATAVCLEPTRVHLLTEATFRMLQTHDPDFSMSVIRTATRRLADGIARNPAAYQGLVAPLDRTQE